MVQSADSQDRRDDWHIAASRPNDRDAGASRHKTVHLHRAIEELRVALAGGVRSFAERREVSFSKCMFWLCANKPGGELSQNL